MTVRRVAVCSSCGYVHGEDKDRRLNPARFRCPECDSISGPHAGDPLWSYELRERRSLAVWWKPWTWGKTVWEEGEDLQTFG